MGLGARKLIAPLYSGSSLCHWTPSLGCFEEQVKGCTLPALFIICALQRCRSVVIVWSLPSSFYGCTECREGALTDKGFLYIGKSFVKALIFRLIPKALCIDSYYRFAFTIMNYIKHLLACNFKNTQIGDSSHIW